MLSPPHRSKAKLTRDSRECGPSKNLLHRDNSKSTLFRSGDGIGEDDLRQEISILRVGIRDVGFCLPKFRLREFHDRTETEVVACLRKIQGEIRLLAELLRHREPLVRLICLLPACANVARDVVP